MIIEDSIRNIFISIILLILLTVIDVVETQQSYCWEPCSFNCPSAAPRLCPSEGILTYYDCCFGQGCCQYIKWPNLIFFIIIIIMLISGCACCLCFMFTDARQQMFARQQNARQENAKVINSTNMESQQTQNLERQIGTIPNESICSKGRSSSTPTSGLTYHKQSTIV